jgi:CO/xanthine dehydrogenase Mo-binding subunit
VTSPSPSLEANPKLSTWLTISADGTVEVRSGKVELGQGVLTALAQIVAEELDIDVSRIRMRPATTDASPDEGYTAGSLSIQNSGGALRAVAAEARALYLELAADRLGARVDDLVVIDGSVRAPNGAEVTYWQLADAGVLDRPASDSVPTKSPEHYRVIGTDVPRLDLRDKLTGIPRFIHDLDLPGLLAARVVRPPARAAQITSIDTAPTRAIPGVVAVVHEGSFLAVVADREEVALRAAERLRSDTRWEVGALLPDEDELPSFIETAPATRSVLAERSSDVTAAVAQSISATYHRPFLAHASIGPSCAVARVTGDDLEVWSHTQGVYPLQREIASGLGFEGDKVVVHHMEGAGCYGHNGADDAAMDAAMIAVAMPGRPVKVVWSRQDELSWSPMGTAGSATISAQLDAAGNVASWHHEVRSGSVTSRPGATPGTPFLAVSERTGEAIRQGGEPPLTAGAGAGRNSSPAYEFPTLQVATNLIPDMPIRTSALRSLGAYLNVFAIESFMDELAHHTGRDPIEYRLDHLSDPRARRVLETGARRAKWADWTPAEDRGHGVAYARYKNTSAFCAVIAEVEALEQLTVRKLTLAVDAGLIISPDGAINQIEGGAIQATSWTVKERVRFDRSAVTNDTWEAYPILRFSEVPEVDVELLPDDGNPSLGVGECAQGPVAAAIANALFDAIGVRVRSTPLTPENIVAAMD